VCSHSQDIAEAKLTLTDTDAEVEAQVESLRKWGIPDGTSYSEDIRRQLDQVAEPPTTRGSMTTPVMPEERICPMCGVWYNKEIPFQTFQQHVSDHFTEDEESYSIITNFEVIS